MSCENCDDYGPESGPYCAHWSDLGYCDQCALENESVQERIATLQRANDLMLANLTAVQARCTELLEEVRRLKAELRDADECAARIDELTS